MSLMEVQQPKWEIFNIDGGETELFREEVRSSYEKIIMGNSDYIPSLHYFIHEDDFIYMNLKVPIIQLLSFGEIIEFLNDDEQDMVDDNLGWFGSSIDHDIKLSLLLDYYFFIDENSDFINNPFILTW